MSCLFFSFFHFHSFFSLFVHFLYSLPLHLHFLTFNCTLAPFCFSSPSTIASPAGHLPQVPSWSDSYSRCLPRWHEEGASVGSHRHDGAVRPPRAGGQKAQNWQEEKPRCDFIHHQVITGKAHIEMFEAYCEGSSFKNKHTGEKMMILTVYCVFRFCHLYKPDSFFTSANYSCCLTDS